MELEIRDISAGPIAKATLNLRGDYAPDRFLIQRASLDWQGQRATARGEIGLKSDSSPVSIETDIEQVSIAKILSGLNGPDIHGTASAKIITAGTRSDPRTNIHIEASGIEAGGELLGDLQAEAELESSRLTLSRLRLEKPQPGGAGILEAHGMVDFNSREYQCSLQGDNLTNLRWLRDVPVSGVLKLDAVGKGNLDNPAFRVEAELKDLQVASETEGNLSGVLELSNHRASLTVKNAMHGIEAVATIATEGDFPVRLDFTAARLPYAFKAIGGSSAAISSAAVVQAEGTLRPAEIREASAKLTGFEIELGKKKISSEKPVELGYAGRRIRLLPATFVSEDVRLQASGDMPLDSEGEPGRISLAGDVGLNSAVAFLSAEQAIHARGKAVLNAAIQGNLRNFDTSATLTIEGGRLEGAALPGVLDEVQTIVELANRRVKINSLGARIGTGTIRGSAEIPLEFVTGASKSQAVVMPARFSVEADKVPLSLTQSGRIAAVVSAGLTGETPAADLKSVVARLNITEVSLSGDSFSIQQVGTGGHNPERRPAPDRPVALDKSSGRGAADRHGRGHRRIPNGFTDLRHCRCGHLLASKSFRFRQGYPCAWI